MEFVLSFFLAPFYDCLHALKYFEPMSHRMGIFKRAAEILEAKPHGFSSRSPTAKILMWRIYEEALNSLGICFEFLFGTVL